MKDYYPLHIKITDEVKKIIYEHKVIFPAYYGKLYTQISKKYDVQLSPSQILNDEMLDEKIVRHIISLSEYAELAIVAMQTQNKQKLSFILDETKKLRNEIEELQALVYEDTLTKCFNRKWFEDKYLENNNRNFSKDGTLLFIDLNRLKRINDSYGHITGDKVIKYLALKLKEVSPFTIRFGGDEFILLFDSDVDIKEIKDQMLILISFFEKTAFKSENNEFKITFAYGDCLFKKGDLLSTVMDKADKKMYIFKEGRRQ